MNKIRFSYTYIHIIIAIVSTLFITSCNSEAVKERPLQLSKQHSIENNFLKSSDDTDFNHNNGTMLSFTEKNPIVIWTDLTPSYTQVVTKKIVADDTGVIIYTSNNTDIATVDSATGAVTFVKAGMVKITATKAATPNKYKGSTAQYTLYITRKPQNKNALIAEIQRAIRSHGNNVDLNYINTSDIKNMSFLFSKDFGSGLENFNGDISQWDVKNVTAMNYMFQGATSFNGDISQWDVSNVTSMSGMFWSATSFNSDVSQWNVKNVTTMSYMFSEATSFNGDISQWNVSKVTNTSVMFAHTTVFNSDISQWNVSKVTDMNNMFFNATSFNRDISNWNVSKVTNMNSMFFRATAFTYKLESWRIKLHERVNVGNMFQNSGVTNFPSWYNEMLP